MLRRILFALSALLLLALIATAWYVSNKGFTRKWRTYIISEFRKVGVEVHIRRLTLDPFRGLVAREVSVLDARNRKRVLAWVDEMLLGVNYASALRGETFLDSADLREANLWLPIDPQDPDGPKVEISKLNARFFLPPQQIYLARAQAEMHGIQLLATGRLLNPQALHPQRGGRTTVTDVLTEVVEELSKLKYGGPPPTLTCEFSGDLAQPGQIEVRLHLQGREVRRKNYELRTVELTANLRKGVLDLQHFRATDAKGEMRASGTYDLATREVLAHTRCSLHLDEIDRAFRWFPHLENWVLTEAPQVEMNIRGKLGPTFGVRITGHAELQRSAYRRIAFRQLSSDFSWEKDGWSLRDFRLAHASGELTGDATCRPQEFRARWRSTLNPRIFAHLLTAEQADWLTRFDFGTPPTLEMELRGPEPKLLLCSGQGQITYSQLLYQNAAVAPGTSGLHLQSGVLRLDSLALTAASAEKSTLAFDFLRHEVRTENSALPQPPDGTPPDGDVEAAAGQ